MNTPLEIMAAIVANGGPVEAWVSQNEIEWYNNVICGVDLSSDDYFYLVHQGELDFQWYKFASLTDPNKTHKPLGPWVNDWARWRAVDSDGKLFEYERKPIIRLSVVWDYPDRDILHYQSLFELISEGHDPANWENSLEKRKRSARPMTPREFAKFVGENMGKFLYRHKLWDHDNWSAHFNVTQDTMVSNHLYAENVPGDLEWKELPQVEVES
jgi:hypothetical protein